MEYRHAAENLQQIGYACVVLHNFLILENEPLSPLETGYLASVVRAAQVRLRIEERISKHITISRFEFPALRGKGGAVGKERRRLLAVELGYLGPAEPLPPIPKAAGHKRRRD